MNNGQHLVHNFQLVIHYLQCLNRSSYYFQGALGKLDLGRLHYKPVKDRNGSTVIVAVNCVIVSILC